MSTDRYDYIIAGAGLSGLSLAWQFIHSSLDDKKILITDLNFRPSATKTWSFWHHPHPIFESFIRKSWKKIRVVTPQETIQQSIETFTYSSISSHTFISGILKELQKHPNIEFIEAPIQAINGNDHEATLTTGDHTYAAEYIFQSCFVPQKIRDDKPDYPLIQHFLGWDLETRHEVFDSSVMTLMDFDDDYKKGIAFVYILPWSSRKALIEYTVFSETVEAKAFYQKKLELYLFNKFDLKRLDFKISQPEYGEIPMQDHRYVPWYDTRVLNIGVSGGLTKPSTGYTFSRIQQHSKAIVKSLENGRQPALPPRSPFRYRAYDLWLLQIIDRHPEQALKIFQNLFGHNSMDDVLLFLGEESSLKKDLQIMSSVSYLPFLKALWKTKRRLISL